MRLAPINQADPVNWTHPLNQGLFGAWFAFPHRYGGPTIIGQCVPGLDATLTNAPSWSSILAPDGLGSVAYNGVNSRSVTPSVTFGGSEFSIRALCYTTDFSVNLSDIASMSTGVYSGDIFILRQHNAPRIEFYVLTGSSISGPAFFAVPAAKRWMDITAVYGASTISLYLDGVIQHSLGASSSSTVTSLPLSIGGANYAPSPSPWNGNIGSVQLWSRALSASEVLALYNESLAGYPTMLNRLAAPASIFPAPPPAGGPFPWFLDQSAMSGGMQTMGL